MRIYSKRAVKKLREELLKMNLKGKGELEHPEKKRKGLFATLHWT